MPGRPIMRALATTRLALRRRRHRRRRGRPALRRRSPASAACTVLLIDHAEKVAEKIRISGGGRCNFTNLDVGAGATSSRRNPHFCRSALARYTPRDFIALVERHGIAWHEKHKGQLFCDGSSEQIIAHAAGRMRRRRRRALAAVRGRRRCAARGAASSSTPTRGAVRRDAAWWSPPAACRSRRSAPATSATALARQFGHRIVEPRPGAGAADLRRRRSWAAVRGAGRPRRCRSRIEAGERQRARPLRRGPAVHAPRPERPGGAADLELLAPGRRRSRIDLAPGTRPRRALLREAKRRSRTLLGATSSPTLLPRAPRRRLARDAAPGLATAPLAELRDRDLAAARPAACTRWELVPDRHRGLPQGRSHGRRRRHARARLADAWKAGAGPGLHFIGEVVDVTGWLGGYNFQWAWASAAACAGALAPRRLMRPAIAPAAEARL